MMLNFGDGAVFFGYKDKDHSRLPIAKVCHFVLRRIFFFGLLADVFGFSVGGLWGRGAC